MSDIPIGNDLSKWFITRTKGTDGRHWFVCPPLRDQNWNKLDTQPVGGMFETGAEAIAHYAAGADIAHFVARTVINPIVLPCHVVESWHGKAAVTQ